MTTLGSSRDDEVLEPATTETHEAGVPAPIGALATVAAPGLWAVLVAQAPSGPVRGLVLALGWVGIATFLDRSRSRRRPT